VTVLKDEFDWDAITTQAKLKSAQYEINEALEADMRR
jgi:hypothetical protein